jgi:hypothetical protein
MNCQCTSSNTGLHIHTTYSQSQSRETVPLMLVALVQPQQSCAQADRISRSSTQITARIWRHSVKKIS